MILNAFCLLKSSRQTLIQRPTLLIFFAILPFIFIIACQPTNTTVGKSLNRSNGATTTPSLLRIQITDANDLKLQGETTELNVGDTLSLKAGLFTSDTHQKRDIAKVLWTLKTISGAINLTLSCGSIQIETCNFTPTAPGSYFIEVTLLKRDDSILIYNDATHPIIVSAPSIPTSLTVKSGQNQVGTVDTNLTSPVVLELKDQFNRPVAGTSVQITVTGGGATVISPNPAVSDGNGLISVVVKLGQTTSTANNNTFLAETVGITPTLSTTFAATAMSGTPHHLLFTTSPQGTYAQIPWSIQPVIELQDQFNNRVLTNSALYVSVIVGTGTLSGHTSPNMINGVVAFTDLSYSSADAGVQIRFSTAGGVSLDATGLNFTLPAGIGTITPNDVNFEPVISEVAGSSGRTFSNAVTMAGLTENIGVAVSGLGNPKLQLNGGPEKSALTDVKNGDIIRIYADPPSTSTQTNTISVVMGGRTETWDLSYVDTNRPAYVFVTSGTYFPKDVGGMSGADNKCQTLATNAGYGGTWTAMLTLGTATLKTRTPWDWGQLRRLDGAIVANSWNDLWDGTLQAPINISENLQTVNNYVWTGSNNAVTGVTSPGSNCNGFTGEPGSGIEYGSSSLTTSGWVQSGASGSSSCSILGGQLYCISNPNSAADSTPNTVSFVDQTTTVGTGRLTSNSVTITGINKTILATVSSANGNATLQINGGPSVTAGTLYNGDIVTLQMDVPATSGGIYTASVNLGSTGYVWNVKSVDASNEAIIFVTSTLAGPATISNLTLAHNNCQNLATAQGLDGQWKALIGNHNSGSLKNLIPWNWGTLRRIDGAVVASGIDDLFDGNIQNPIQIDETGTTRNYSVWTGVTNSNGDFTTTQYLNTTCQNWLTTNTNAAAKMGQSSSTSSLWVTGTNLACNLSAAYYCISDPAATFDSNPSEVHFLKEVSYVSGARTTSNSVLIKGITKPINVSVSGFNGNPQIKINGGSEVTSGTANWGQTVEVVMDAPTTLGQTHTATVVLGSLITQWTLGYADSNKVARIFVTTRSNYQGNLGGLSGADSLCNQDALDAGFTGGSWKALLSDSLTNARDRIPFNWGTLKRTDGTTIIANSWSDLWDGTIQNPILTTANQITNSSNSILSFTQSNGIKISSSDPLDNCEDWTNNFLGNYPKSSGNSSLNSANWIANGGWGPNRCYGSSNSFYCIEDSAAGDDLTPSTFEVPYKIFQTTSARIESDTVTISGITGSAAIVLSGSDGSPAFKINGGAEVTTGSITNGQTLTLVMTSPASYNQSYKVDVKVGTGTFVPWRVWTGNAASGIKKRIFITSTAYNGAEIGGLSGGNSLCNTIAANNSNLNGATWKVLISSDSLSENTWAINNIGYNWSEIWTFNNDGSFKDKIFDANSIWGPNPMTNTMSTDEMGANVTASPIVITNTSSSGRGVLSASSACTGFTSNGPNMLIVGQVGLSNWLSNSSNLYINCISTIFTKGHIYCIEQ